MPSGALIKRMSGFAVVGGTSFPLSQVSASYARNNIPSCSLVLAVGRTARGAQRSLAEALNASSGSRVTLEVVVDDGLVFMGYVTGNTFIRTFGTAGVQVTGSSFLGDMHATSALSSAFSSLVPGKMIGRVSVPGGSAGAHSISAVNAWNIEKLPDLWAMFTASAAALAKSPEATAAILAAATGSSYGAGSSSNPFVTGNTLGSAALSKVKGDLVLSPWSPTMATAIAGTVNEIILGDEGGQTLFSKLLTAGMNFGFSFIPRVTDALAVAAFPFSRSVSVIISPDEYAKIEASMQRPFPTSSVALMGSSQLATVDASSSRSTPTRIGFYDSGIPGGVMHLQSAIKWLNGMSPNTAGTRKTSGAETPRYVGRPQPTVQSTSQAPDRSDTTMGDAYAKWIWNNIAYANRSAPVTTAYRTDICPGSSVMLECPDLEGSIPLYGFVEAVTLGVDAMGATAGTNLLLSSIRTQSEMAEGAQGKHPLFQTTFHGGRLLPA